LIEDFWMFALVLNEVIKLKRSLVLVVCVAAPICAASFPLMVMLNRPGPKPWVQLLAEGAAVWAYFMYPMAVTALSVLMAQIEHGPRMWNHLLALPISRLSIFLAKIFVLVALVVLMSLALYLSLYATILLGVRIIPGAAATGDPQFGETFESILLLGGAGLMMVVVQLWIALRFKNFAAPLIVGIVGTFLALATHSAKHGVFLPWLAPAYTFTLPAPVSVAVVGFGYLGGLLLIPIMIAHLAQHEQTS
jgi:lantibiotic transport system permease protein